MAVLPFPRYQHLPLRVGIGIILLDVTHSKIMTFRCVTPSHEWKLPQGALNPGEIASEALWRELREETGLTATDTTLLTITNEFTPYYYENSRVETANRTPAISGQSHRWAFLEFHAAPEKVNLETTKHPEFTEWKWVAIDDLIATTAPKKHETYRQALSLLNRYLTDSAATTPGLTPPSVS